MAKYGSRLMLRSGIVDASERASTQLFDVPDSLQQASTLSSAELRIGA